jgi:hypothetical protein
MKLKTIMCLTVACFCVAAAEAQSRNKKSRNSREAAQELMDSKVKISQMPSIGPQSLVEAPRIQAQGGLQPITKGRRQWGVFDMTYRTQQRWTEDIIVNWHVLCDTSKAKQKDKSKAAKRLPPYIYYTLTTRYVNIPEGDHRSCVCLPPSYIERYGEPVVISCELVNAEGKVLNGGTVSSGFSYVTQGLYDDESKEKMQWWVKDEIINAKDRQGESLIEIRQGLVDRSKSPFYLVNNADYEAIQ